MDASYCDIFAVRFAPESKESEESGRRIRGIRKQNPKNPEESKRIQRIQRKNPKNLEEKPKNPEENPERKSEESGRESQDQRENLKNPGSRVQRICPHVFYMSGKQYCGYMTLLPHNSNTPLYELNAQYSLRPLCLHGSQQPRHRRFSWYVISLTKRINNFLTLRI